MKQVDVYGKVFAGGQVYSLINPQPIPRDSCWNDGTYMFLVANPRGEATTIVTNSFTLEYMSTPEKMVVSGMLEDEAVGQDDFAVTYDLPEFDPLVEPDDLAELIDQGNWEDAGVPPDEAFWGEGEEDYE